MSRTYRQQLEVEACRDYILNALEDEMAKRKFRQYADWVDRERQAVILAANEWAVSYASPHTLHTVTEAEVEAVEDMAVGHVDYAKKWTLYVAEMIYRP